MDSFCEHMKLMLGGKLFDGGFFEMTDRKEGLL